MRGAELWLRLVINFKMPGRSFEGKFQLKDKREAQCWNKVCDVSSWGFVDGELAIRTRWRGTLKTQMTKGVG